MWSVLIRHRIAVTHTVGVSRFSHAYAAEMRLMSNQHRPLLFRRVAGIIVLSAAIFLFRTEAIFFPPFPFRYGWLPSAINFVVLLAGIFLLTTGKPRVPVPPFIQQPRNWAGGTILLGVVLASVLRDPEWFPHIGALYGWWFQFGIPLFFVLPVVLIWLFRFEIPRIMELERHHGNVCWNCGYPLEGNVSGSCPECAFSDLEDGKRHIEQVEGCLWIVRPICKWFLRNRLSGAEPSR